MSEPISPSSFASMLEDTVKASADLNTFILKDAELLGPNSMTRVFFAACTPETVTCLAVRLLQLAQSQGAVASFGVEAVTPGVQGGGAP